jgi:anti-anti-sigma factor
MKMSVQDYEQICVLTLSGEFTAEDVDAFCRTTSERIDSGSRHMFLDCEHLEFVDSAALECWLQLRENIGNLGGQIRLLQPDDTIKQILELTRLDNAFESYDTLETAVRSVR